MEQKEALKFTLSVKMAASALHYILDPSRGFAICDLTPNYPWSPEDRFRGQGSCGILIPKSTHTDRKPG